MENMDKMDAQQSENDIERFAKEFGISPSSLKRYAELMLEKVRSQPMNMTALIEDAVAAAMEKKEGETFSVSSLLPAEVWEHLDRGQKQTIASAIRNC